MEETIDTSLNTSYISTPTEAPTETPTEAPTEAPTETPTEAPKSNRPKIRTVARETTPVENSEPHDYGTEGTLAYTLYYGAGAKTNLDTWLDEADSEEKKQRIINHALWLNGRVYGDDNKHLLGKFNSDGTESAWVSEVKKSSSN